MGRIPRDIVDAVRDRTDIAEVVGRHVTLRKQGASLVGLCPFHQEKSPSFHVVPAKAMFHCFGCQAGGDVFAFLMMIEGLSFVECVKELAGPAGVTIPERELTDDEVRALRARATLFDVLEEAASFFESTLWTHPDGQPGRDYLRSRGLSDGIARGARLGYAPEGWTRLLDHLHRARFPAERVLEAGLARPRNSGDGHYDAFRARLMFPIRDERNRVVGFGGRLLDGEGPKYINTPETKLYDKSRVLYGIETARTAIQRADRAIVVEGYFDVLAMQQAGVPETVASCGTALTRDHCERIRRMTRNVILLTDGDNAGQAAAERALPLMLDAGLHGYRVDLPDAKDPDEFVQRHGADALAVALERRESLVEWVVRRKLLQYADRTASGSEVTAQSRMRVLEELQPLLGRMPEALLHRVAARIGVREEVLRERMQGAAVPQVGATPKAAGGWRAHRDMTHVFWLLVHTYDQVADLLQRVDPSVFADHPETHEAIARLLTGEPVAAVIAEAQDEGVRRALHAVVARQGLYEPDQAARALCDVLWRLARPRLVAERSALTAEMEETLRSGDADARRGVLLRNQALSRRERALSRALEAGDLDGFVAALSGWLNGSGSRA